MGAPMAETDPPRRYRPLRRQGLWVAAVVALALVPPLGGSYLGNIVVEVLIFAILAMSLDLILGYTGLISFGHATYFGIGAYAAILCGGVLGLGGWLGLLVGIVGAGAAAAAIGAICTRVGGIPFLMLTMAFGQLVYSVSLKWRGLTGGSDGIGGLARPSLFGWSLNDPLAFYYTVLALFLLSYFALRRLIDSPLGHVFVGIRENESRMRAIGYPTRRYKQVAFIIAGAFGGLSGGLYALFNGFISPESLHWTASGDVLMMVILGGVGTLVGPVIGTAVFLIMKNLVSSYNDHWMMIVGVIFVCCVMFFRQGLYGWLLGRLGGGR